MSSALMVLLVTTLCVSATYNAETQSTELAELSITNGPHEAGVQPIAETIYRDGAKGKTIHEVI